MPVANSISDLSALGVATTPTQQTNGDLAQEDFLALMVAQFQNQDPFKPMENGDFLGQLAQFGTVSGIEELQASFNQFANNIHSDQALQASSMIGRQVLVDSTTGNLPDGGSLSGAVEMPVSSSAVFVDITDASGQVVRTLSLGQQSAGLAEFTWDGITQNGETAPAGNYEITARIQGNDGFESVPAMVSATVQSVTLGRYDGSLTLNLDGLPSVYMYDVRQIS